MNLVARVCGECTLCCTILRAPALGKPEMVKCIHCDIGCMIHETRPQSCRDFKCEWLNGKHSDSMRPDLSHIVLEKLPDVPVVLALIECGFAAVITPQVTAELTPYTEQGITVAASNGQALLAPGHTPKMINKYIKQAAKSLGVIA